MKSGHGAFGDMEEAVAFEFAQRMMNSLFLTAIVAT